jgi:hypothetical protein
LVWHSLSLTCLIGHGFWYWNLRFDSKLWMVSLGFLGIKLEEYVVTNLTYDFAFLFTSSWRLDFAFGVSFQSLQIDFDQSKS